MHDLRRVRAGAVSAGAIQPRPNAERLFDPQRQLLKLAVFKLARKVARIGMLHPDLLDDRRRYPRMKLCPDVASAIDEELPQRFEPFFLAGNRIVDGIRRNHLIALEYPLRQALVAHGLHARGRRNKRMPIELFLGIDHHQEIRALAG